MDNHKSETLYQLYSFMCFLLFLLILFPPVYSLAEGYTGFKFVLYLEPTDLVASGRFLLIVSCMALYTLALRAIYFSGNDTSAEQSDSQSSVA